MDTEKAEKFLKFLDSMIRFFEALKNISTTFLLLYEKYKKIQERVEYANEQKLGYYL